MLADLFDVLEQLRQELIDGDIEPQELKDLCSNPVFRALCAYCRWRDSKDALPELFSSLDR